MLKNSKSHLSKFESQDISEPATVPRWLQKLPNQLTFLRILCIPIVVYLLIYSQDAPVVAFNLYFFKTSVITPGLIEIIAGWVFGLAALTDFFDGWIARRFKTETILGRLLDPLADKLLVVSCLIILVEKHRLFGWVAALLIVRDLAMNAIRISALDDGILIPSNSLGKLKTVFQTLGIIGLIVYGQHWGLPFNLIGYGFIFLAVVVSIVSAVQYLTSYVRQVKERSRQ